MYLRMKSAYLTGMLERSRRIAPHSDSPLITVSTTAIVIVYRERIYEKEKKYRNGDDLPVAGRRITARWLRRWRSVRTRRDAARLSPLAAAPAACLFSGYAYKDTV
ncbi:hypothetical protein J6590_013244 [Homalodisca vitripennis]|nr:hypothetical protein J6590_013244 [Homalodisca vitripennis]